jgi:hypothetical protein
MVLVLIRKNSPELLMILVSPNESSFTLELGIHRFPVSRTLLISFASVLVKERIAEMADLQNPWQSENWLLEGADDDRKEEPNTKREFRKRLLLHIGDQKWHLSQEECLKLGNQCRSLLEIR